MNFDEYSRLAVKTAAQLGYEKELVHYTLGLVDEVGELASAVKKNIAYGKPLDIVNIKEELGDLMWFASNLMTLLEIDFDEVLEKNIKKLSVRYPNGFNKQDALVRNLQSEREVLE
jgi:NTP pyrophosphatase (non-canonical NTP hydrolase)